MGETIAHHRRPRALNGSALGAEASPSSMRVVTLDKDALGSGWDADGRESNWPGGPLDGHARSSSEESIMDWSTVALLAAIIFICISGLLVIGCLFSHGSQQRWRKRSFVWVVDPTATVAMRVWVPAGGMSNVPKVHPEFELPGHIDEGFGSGPGAGDVASPSDDDVLKPAQPTGSLPLPPKAPPPLLPHVHCTISPPDLHRISHGNSGSRERADDLEVPNGSSRLPASDNMASRPTSAPPLARRRLPPASSGLPAAQRSQVLRSGSIAEVRYQTLTGRPNSATVAPSVYPGLFQQRRGRMMRSGDIASWPTSASYACSGSAAQPRGQRMWPGNARPTSAPSSSSGSAVEQRRQRVPSGNAGNMSCQAMSMRPTSAPLLGAAASRGKKSGHGLRSQSVQQQFVSHTA